MTQRLENRSEKCRKKRLIQPFEVVIYEWSIVLDDVTLVVFQLSVTDSQARGFPIQEAMVSLEHGTHEH